MQVIDALIATRDETVTLFVLDEEALALFDAADGLSRDLYLASRAWIIHYAALHDEQNRHLEWIHSETGLRTLRDEFDKVIRHNETHVKQIRIALDRQSASQG